MQYDYTKILKGLFWGIAVCIFISMCTSCKQTEYISVPEYHEIYVNKTDTLMQKDSIILRDSVYVLQKGDTLLVEKWHTQYIDKLVYKNHTDTLVRTDSISVPYEVVKKNSALHTFTYNIGILALLILAVMVAGYTIRKFIVK